MTLTFTAFLTISGMLIITYSTRLAGFFIFKNKKLSSKMARVTVTAPACVLISVIAPHFVSNQPPEILALIITMIAAWRLPMLPTVLIAVGSSACLTHFFN